MIEARTSGRDADTPYLVAVGDHEPFVLVSGKKKANEMFLFSFFFLKKNVIFFKMIGENMTAYRFALHQFIRACLFLLPETDEEVLAQSNRTTGAWIGIFCDFVYFYLFVYCCCCCCFWEKLL